MANIDSTRPSKANKGTTDRLKALEVALFELRSGESDKNWQQVDKCLQVLLKVSDLQCIRDREHLLLGLQWLLTKSTAPSAPVMHTIQLLTRLCIQIPPIRTFLRDNLGMATSLTRLLESLGTNASASCAKVLDLLRYICLGISIIRQESYLEKLIHLLLRFIRAKDANSSNALGILACLCHNNYLVGKLLLASMTSEERKDLYSSSFDDARTKVYLEFLISGLSRRHFVSATASNGKFATVERHLATISDAFCAAYAENDVFSLSLCLAFVRHLQDDLAEEQLEKLQESLMHTIRQLFCVADFAEGSREANGLLFCFTRHLASLHGSNLGLLDVTAKAVLLYVETISGTADIKYLYEAILMFASVLDEAVLTTMTTTDSIKDETLMSSLKLQVDPLLSSFNDLLTSYDGSKGCLDLEQDLRSLQSILECSRQIAQVDDWAEIVGGHLSNPPAILARLKSFEDQLASSSRSICVGPILLAFFKLAEKLKDGNKKWERVSSDLSESITKSWVKCYRGKCHSQLLPDYFRAVEANNGVSQAFWNLLASADQAENNGGSLEAEKVCWSSAVAEDKNKLREVDHIIAQVATTLENNDISECLAGVWELQEYKLMAHQSKIESLKEALRAADEGLCHQRALNTQLELENAKLNGFTKALLHRVDVTSHEITDVRRQCDSVSQDATNFRSETAKELKRKQEDIEILESNQARLEAKLAKYKEKCEALQETIKEHQTVQDELHEKLKAESKTNSELTTALAKKDEKLKKKEKCLEEQTTAHDALKKEISSLQNLNKRLEAAVAKKEKQYNEVSEKLSTFKQIQAQIFSLSKTVRDDQEDD